MRYPSGGQVEGLWQDDCLQGQAVFKYANGDSYTGQF